jgi:hypothetical protein
MSKFKRGKPILGMMSAMFTIDHRSHVYFCTSILPTLQLRTWTISKLRAAVRDGKLFYAVTGEEQQDEADKAMLKALEDADPDTAMRVYSDQSPPKIRSLDECLDEWHQTIAKHYKEAAHV